uniref:Sushi domain-containing protein n=1 Tax=Anabas testudineus TaxID=64144 RepID=A0A3Q1JIE1_ANATE
MIYSHAVVNKRLICSIWWWDDFIPVKMCIRYLGFILLWFPGGLHSQSVTQSCSAPSLDHGFFAPKQEIYSHGKKLTYTCNDGYKPAEKSWWVTSTCENGKWSHQPQCIDESFCAEPNIPNGKYTKIQTGWYKVGATIGIRCDQGYEHKNQAVTARCQDGAWTTLPICEKSINACSEPPKIQHAVIINQEYQEVFAVDSEVQYECEDGFTTEGGDTKEFIYCLSGTWTKGPTCSVRAKSDTGISIITSFIITVDNCGRLPHVPNGDVVEQGQMFLKYQCSSFYTRVGPEKVTCNSDGTWSPLPTCEAAFCTLDPAQYPYSNLRPGLGVEYIKEGETKNIPCKWDRWSMPVKCINRQMISHYRCKYTLHLAFIF